MCQTRPGQEIIVEEGAHIFTSEQGGVSRFGGLMVNRVKGTLGYPAPEDIEAAIRPTDNVHTPRTGLICLENTHNRAGGTVMTPEKVKAVTDMAHGHGIPVHVDGARIFNAAVALDTDVKELVKDVDTITFCLSKGLSCPAGAILAGPEAKIAEARRLRKVLGGTMRQAGVIAAPGIVALTQMIDRLADDHDNAFVLAEGLSQIDALDVDLETVETNIVFADIDGLGFDTAELAKRLAQYNVEVLLSSPTRIRMVTHRMIERQHIEYVVEVFKEIARAA
jgi:threonine aldolase